MDPQCLGLSLELLWLSQPRVKARYANLSHSFFSQCINVMKLNNIRLQAELDRFCDALISIREEIAQIEKGNADVQNNVLKVIKKTKTHLIMSSNNIVWRSWDTYFGGCSCSQGAPHPPSLLMADTWKKPYSREYAAFPAPWLRSSKFWPTTGIRPSKFSIQFILVSRFWFVTNDWNVEQGVWTTYMETGNWCALSSQRKNKSQLQYLLDYSSVAMCCVPFSHHVLFSFTFCP